MDSTFRKLRALKDRDLALALTNHKQTLEWLVLNMTRVRMALRHVFFVAVFALLVGAGALFLAVMR